VLCSDWGSGSVRATASTVDGLTRGEGRGREGASAEGFSVEDSTSVESRALGVGSEDVVLSEEVDSEEGDVIEAEEGVASEEDEDAIESVEEP